jgi:hypothetical protein
MVNASDRDDAGVAVLAQLSVIITRGALLNTELWLLHKYTGTDCRFHALVVNVVTATEIPHEQGTSNVCRGGCYLL